ncbi:exonuclease domain-containing protein [Corynebacterium liangguodongii]|uniref:DNA polymerase III subunit epsilon n=1 Tax=Corynebacterium liangguodongii TaxID=2079535 RepID=A0A2S0WD59_9CORY|nr:exonuclease domain-containing protein [Corynebacterium liangguodongii]AWB83690.1 DNA polymerase III subunit epsilon [Corynebacterium liangguodongii]PWB99500.1 DNA polymerase III subunit epsilon [Corynebacterium liangguodongii]
MRSRSFIPSRADLLAPEFVTVDFETANRRGGPSACQIALVKVAGDEIVETLVSYLRPPEEHMSFEFTHIHGIRAEDVADAPYFFDIADDVAGFVDGLPVWAHNAAFDAAVWRGLDDYYCTGTVPERFYCTYRTARRAIPGLPNYKLPTVTAVCAPSFELVHHAADSDAIACAHIVRYLRLR